MKIVPSAGAAPAPSPLPTTMSSEDKLKFTQLLLKIQEAENASNRQILADTLKANNEMNRQSQQRISELRTLTIDRNNQICFQLMDRNAFVRYKTQNEIKKIYNLPVMSDEEIRQQVEMDRQIRNGVAQTTNKRTNERTNVDGMERKRVPSNSYKQINKRRRNGKKKE